MEEQPLSAIAGAWRLTQVSVPIAFVLWGCAFLAARSGRGDLGLIVLLYAPLALLGVRVAIGGGMLLHLAYAACADLAQRRRVRPGWLVGLAALHYACVGIAAWGPARDDWPNPGVAVWTGVAVFLAWQVFIAASVMRRAPRRR